MTMLIYTIYITVTWVIFFWPLISTLTWTSSFMDSWIWSKIVVSWLLVRINTYIDKVHSFCWNLTKPQHKLGRELAASPFNILLANKSLWLLINSICVSLVFLTLSSWPNHWEGQKNSCNLGHVHYLAVHTGQAKWFCFQEGHYHP